MLHSKAFLNMERHFFVKMRLLNLIW